jgi:hypothetical protein
VKASRETQEEHALCGSQKEAMEVVVQARVVGNCGTNSVLNFLRRYLTESPPPVSLQPSVQESTDR